MSNIAIVYLLLVFAYACHVVSGVGGPKCYSCEKVPDAQDCDNIVQCAEDEKCYSQRIIGGDLQEFYKLGCTSNAICVRDEFSFFGGFGFGKKREISIATAHTHALSKRLNKDDMVLCLQCCNGEYCNNNLCGASDQHKVLRCFKCDDVLHPRDCDTVEECGNHDQCKAAQSTQQNNNLGCFACCKDKPYCNLNACNKNATGTESSQAIGVTAQATTEATTETPTTTSAPPPISIYPGPHVSTLYTQPIAATCTSDPGVNISWTYMGSQVLPIGATVTNNRLLITELNETNAGIYKCIALSSSGSLSVSKLNISIKPTPAIVVKVDKAPTHSLVENGRLTIECIVIGYPTPNVTWAYIGLGGETRVPSDVSFSEHDRLITIDRYDSVHNDGKWTCLATNAVGHSQGTTNIP